MKIIRICSFIGLILFGNICYFNNISATHSDGIASGILNSFLRSVSREAGRSIGRKINKQLFYDMARTVSRVGHSIGNKITTFITDRKKSRYRKEFSEKLFELSIYKLAVREKENLENIVFVNGIGLPVDCVDLDDPDNVDYNIDFPAEPPENTVFINGKAFSADSIDLADHTEDVIGFPAEQPAFSVPGDNDKEYEYKEYRKPEPKLETGENDKNINEEKVKNEAIELAIKIFADKNFKGQPSEEAKSAAKNLVNYSAEQSMYKFIEDGTFDKAKPLTVAEKAELEKLTKLIDQSIADLVRFLNEVY